MERPERKAEIRRLNWQKEQISLDQVIAVGIGANDLPMLEHWRSGIAFNCKPVVEEVPVFLSPGLDGILYLIGRCRDRYC